MEHPSLLEHSVYRSIFRAEEIVIKMGKGEGCSGRRSDFLQTTQAKVEPLRSPLAQDGSVVSGKSLSLSDAPFHIFKMGWALS